MLALEHMEIWNGLTFFPDHLVAAIKSLLK